MEAVWVDAGEGLGGEGAAYAGGRGAGDRVRERDEHGMDRRCADEDGAAREVVQHVLEPGTTQRPEVAFGGGRLVGGEARVGL